MSPSLTEQVAGEIRAELARKQMTQDELRAELRDKGVKMSPATLGRRLKGAGAFRLDELEAIAAVLEVPLGALTAGAAA